MFAERGLRATTVRDIADAAGILSGSLYHHFDSKEAIVDELLRDFLEGLFARYREIAAANLNPVDTLKGLFLASFDAIETKHAQVAIYQAEAPRLLSQERFAYLNELNTEQRQLWLEVLRDGVRRVTSAPTWMWRWCTDSSATPPGCRCGGSVPVAHVRRRKSPNSIFRSFSAGSPSGHSRIALKNKEIHHV